MHSKSHSAPKCTTPLLDYLLKEDIAHETCRDRIFSVRRGDGISASVHLLHDSRRTLRSVLVRLWTGVGGERGAGRRVSPRDGLWAIFGAERFIRRDGLEQLRRIGRPGHWPGDGLLIARNCPLCTRPTVRVPSSASRTIFEGSEGRTE